MTKVDLSEKPLNQLPAQKRLGYETVLMLPLYPINSTEEIWFYYTAEKLINIIIIFTATIIIDICVPRHHQAKPDGSRWSILRLGTVSWDDKWCAN